METNFVFHKNQSSASAGDAITNVQGSLYVAASGTFTGTIVVQGKQGDNWYDLNVIDLRDIKNSKQITSTGAYAVVAPSGFEAVRCNIVSITSGAVTVTGRACDDSENIIPFSLEGGDGGDSGGDEGGGSSDFSTCTVTIVNNSEGAIYLYLPNITEQDAYGEPSIIADAFSGGMRSTDVFTCALYKGKAIGAFPDDNRPSQSDVTVSGSISYDYDANFITITGDGTLTIDY